MKGSGNLASVSESGCDPGQDSPEGWVLCSAREVLDQSSLSRLTLNSPESVSMVGLTGRLPDLRDLTL